MISKESAFTFPSSTVVTMTPSTSAVRTLMAPPSVDHSQRVGSTSTLPVARRSARSDSARPTCSKG